MPEEDKSLYDRLGGEDAIKATVVKMYEKILQDPQISHFFAETDMERLRRSQTAFVRMAFGGPDTYSGQLLENAHAKAVKEGLNDNHFDSVKKHLGDAMTELGVANDLVEEALTTVETTRVAVLGK